MMKQYKIVIGVPKSINAPKIANFLLLYAKQNECEVVCEEVNK